MNNASRRRSLRRHKLYLATVPLLVPGLAAAQQPAPQSQGLEEIIVTAQFRAQNVQQTPISISAFDAEMLDARAATDINDAANLAPNVTLSRGAAGFGQMSAIFIRGVGQADPHFAVEPGVGMYIDDVYFGVMTGSIFELLDTDRVEVLRGPQGTLAGKNSIGGAIKLFSEQPGPEANGYAEFGFGTFDGITGRAATNLTIAEDKLHARVSVMARERNGYMDRLDYNCATGQLATGTRRLRQDCVIGTQGGESMWAARGVLRWTPGDRVDNSFTFDVTARQLGEPGGQADLPVAAVGRYRELPHGLRGLHELRGLHKPAHGHGIDAVRVARDHTARRARILEQSERAAHGQSPVPVDYGDS